MNDSVLIEIMAKQSTKNYKAWLKDRGKKVEPDQNSRVSNIIDRLNKKLSSNDKDDLCDFSDSDSSLFYQGSLFDF